MDAVPPTPTPADQYRERIQQRTTEAATLQRRHIWLGYSRLVLVLAGVALAWLSLREHALSPWWLILPCIAFVVVARLHSAVLLRRSCAQRAITFFERGLARIDDRWSDLPAHSTPVDTSSSLFADDLDLFTPGGLFDLLSTARTSLGEAALAHALLNPAARDTILARQQAVAELRELFALREQIAETEGPDLAQLDAAQLAAWATPHHRSVPTLLRWIAPLLVLLTIAAFVYYLLFDRGIPLALILLIDVTLTFFLQSTTQKLFAGAERASHSLRLAARLIARLEREPFRTPLLQDLHRAFTANNRTASAALRRLALLAQFIEYRANYIVRILDAPLMYSVQLAAAINSWQRAHGPALQPWLRALADFEALLSLATYSFEHPADPFPDILDGPPAFIADQLGHPLLPAAACVRNDVALGPDARLLLVSGSNMSGKSTLLRSIGTNIVLATAGAPVRAARLRLTPLHVAASIQIHDSLQQGRSRFYAEVLRLRDIVALTERDLPVLFLLDELLAGTNSVDRLAGAEGIARSLLANGAIGLISTHDLALTAIAAGDLPLRNVHFEDRIQDGQMIFDFKLRDGVVTHRNGLALMRLVGLNV